MFWFSTVCLFIFAAGFVLVPLWLRGRSESFEREASRKNENIALFQERSDELESELASGNLDQAQFDLLLLELQQSLLADISNDEDDDVSKNQDKKYSASSSKSRFSVNTVIPLFLCLLMPMFAYYFYDKWGYYDDVELMELFQRTVNNRDSVEESQNLIVTLGQFVQENDDRPWAWYFLAENFANLGMFAEAEIAYTQSSLRMSDGAEKALVLGRVAMAKYILADLNFTEEVLKVVEQARAINPNEISILQLLAADADQRADYKAAIEYWRLIIQSNPNSEQAQQLRQNVANAQQKLAEEDQDIGVGPSININLALTEGIDLDENLRVFVAVRNAEREGLPPLAAVDLTVADLPTSISLDNSYAVGPFNLSSAELVYVSASVSFSGSATPSSGDYRVQSDHFAHKNQETTISLEISDRIP